MRHHEDTIAKSLCCTPSCSLLVIGVLEWVNQIWYLHRRRYHSAIGKSEIPTDALMQSCFCNTNLNKSSQTQKPTRCDAISVECSEGANPSRKLISGCLLPDRDGGEMEKVGEMGRDCWWTWGYFGGVDENILEADNDCVTFKHTKTYRIEFFRWVKSVEWKLYPNKPA